MAFLAGLAMLATGGIAAATANAAEPEVTESEPDAQVTVVTGAAALKEALEKGGSVKVDKDMTIELTEPITITSAATLMGEGTIKLTEKDKFEKGNSKAPITVNTGASLTVDGVTFDGSGVSYGYGNRAGGMLYVAGNLDFESGTVQNVFSSKADGDNVGAIYVGNGGKFTMKDGALQNNTLWGTPYDAKGAVLVDEGGSFVLDGGTLAGNTAAGAYGLSGVVVVNESGSSTPGSFTMNGGSIANNKSTAVKVGGNGSGYPAMFNMRGGTISGNIVTHTGDDDNDSSTESDWNTSSAGVYVGFGDFEMSGGTISGNDSAKYGGGVFIAAPYNGTAFTMTGGTISDNTAAVGGGVFVTHAGSVSPNVTLSGGNIVNNKAKQQGGGVYVVNGDTVHLENVAIYGNTATAVSESRAEDEGESTPVGRAGIGGGVWTCATGNLKVYIDNGGAVFDNKADNAGDDLSFVNHYVGGGTAEFNVSDRMIGGGQVGYYKDGGITAGAKESHDGMGASYLGDPDGSARYNASQPGKAITNDELNVTKNNYALKSGVTDAAKAAAKGNAKLVISGNTANRGGGVGANGNVIIGTAPGEQHDEVKLIVNKEWKDENDQTIDAPQDSVTVALKSGDSRLDTVELNKDNNWTNEFTGLPKLADNATYTVEETTVPDGFTPSYSETECGLEPKSAAEANDSDDVTDGTGDFTTVISCKVTVTNTKEPETPPTPPTPPSTDTEGDLTVEKKVKGEDVPKDREFTFDVTLTDANGNPVNGTYGKVTFTDGKATVTLKAGEKITMTGIPETYKYTVSEHLSDGFVTTVPGNATGTVGDGHVTVTFTNTWKDLTVNLDPGKKFLEGRELKAGEFTFELWDGDKLIDTATNTVDASDPHYGGFSFSFAQEANTTKTYVMKERKGDLANVTYDTREYQVTVVTGDKGVTSVTYSPELEAGGVVFHNVYEEPKPTPTPEPTPTPTPLPETPKSDKPVLSQTGVAVASIAGAALLIAAAGIALVIARRRRAQR